VVGLGLGAALVCTAASAQEHWSAAERARIFVTSPNWTGLWESKLSAESDNLTGYASGYSRDRLAVLHRDFKLLAKPPYKPGWERTRRTNQKSTASGATAGSYQTTGKLCGDAQFPALLELPLMFQVLVTPEETLFLYENGEVRHIYTDGRQHPKPEDLWPTATGNSIGHWEGATLVIDTVETHSGPILPTPGAADLSEQAHFTERIRRLDADTLQDDTTIDDPVRFAHPWQVSIRWSRVLDQDRLLPLDCGNDRNPVVNGKMTVAPPQ
jgi:hypothetical protein